MIEGSAIDNGSVISGSVLNTANNENYLNDMRTQSIIERDDGSVIDAFEGILN